MRNYITAFLIQWQVSIYDDTHTLIDQFFTSMAGDTRDDLMLNVNSDNDLIRNSLPLNWTAEFAYPNDPKQAWFLFDKNTFMHLLKTLPDFFYGDIQTTDPESQVLRTTVEKSPRRTGWKDQAGVTRAPSPSDTGKTVKFDVSGADQLLNAFSSLVAYESVLRQEGRVRDANIVQFAIDQVTRGLWTIVEAFAYLDENGLA